MTPQNTALILLASGLSRRYGPENKLLAELSGKPLIHHVVETIAPLSFNRKVAVVCDDPLLIEYLETVGFQCVLNPDPSRGLKSSRTLGIKAALAQGCEAALILLADMPFIPGTHIKAVLKKAETHDAVFSLSGDAMMPPAAFRKKALCNLLEGVDMKEPGSATIPLSTQLARDIDTQDDLAAAASLP